MSLPVQGMWFVNSVIVDYTLAAVDRIGCILSGCVIHWSARVFVFLSGVEELMKSFESVCETLERLTRIMHFDQTVILMEPVNSSTFYSVGVTT